MGARVISVVAAVSAKTQPVDFVHDWRFCSVIRFNDQVKQLLKWAKKARPVARVGLALASIALKVCTGLSIPTADFEAALGTTAGGALSEYVKEALDSRVEAMSGVARERLEGAGMVEEAQNSDAHSPGQNKVRLILSFSVDIEDLPENPLITRS